MQAVLLILLGGATLRISLTDIYLRYVKDAMQPFLIATGVIIAALGVMMLVDVIRNPRPAPAPVTAGDGESSGLGSDDPGANDVRTDDHGAHDQDGPGEHAHLRVAWLMLLPVLAIFLVAPPALGAFSAARDPGRVSAPVNYDWPALPDDPVVELSVAEFSQRAIWDESRSLAGREVMLVGFVTPLVDGEPSGASWYVTRHSMACCAADAVASKVAVFGAPPLPSDTWIRVVGQWRPVEGTDSIPEMTAESVEQIKPPRNPYE